MPFTGPWLTPPPQTTNAPMLSGDAPMGISLIGANFAALCETGPFDAPTGGTSSALAELQNQSGTYSLYQLQWSYNFPANLLGVAFIDYPPPVLPPNAIDVEYEGWPGGDYLPTITNIHATLTVADVTTVVTPISVGLRFLSEPPAELHYSLPGGGLPDYHWLSGAQIAARTALGTATLGSSASSVLLDADLPVADIETAHGTSDGRRDLHVNLVFDAQVTHAAPAVGTGRWVAISHYDGLVTYQPPRYRFVYDKVSRLRQFPRDDFLGGAPRQGDANGATSIQSSARQGWKNTYR